MKSLRLLSMELENFQGIRRYTLALDGHDADIFADNGVGKTTLSNAFFWALTDKDLLNRKEFEIKTLNANGEAIPKLDHGVTLVFELPDGRRLKLRKVFREVWTQKRGSAQKTLTGHTTDYYVDDVPVSKTEYAQRVASAIADESLLRLLSDPMHFNVHMSWQERRDLLLKAFGDVSVEEVIASDPELKGLPEILGDRTPEQHKRALTERRKQVQKELDQIPARMEEVRRGMPALPQGKDRARIKAEMDELNARKREKEQEKARIEAGGEIAAQRRRLAEIEAAMLEIANDFRQQNQAQIAQKQGEVDGLRNRIHSLRREADRLHDEAKAASDRANLLEQQMNELRAEWHRVNAEQFVHEAEETCPACGQAIPPEQIEEARQKALAAFNEAKARRLAQINETGSKLKEQKATAEREASEKFGKMVQIDAEIDALEGKVRMLLGEIEALKTSSVEEDPDYLRLAAEKKAVEEAIAELEAGSGASARIKELDDEISTLGNQLYFLSIDLAAFEQRDKAEERLRELDEEQRRLSSEYERIEKELFLLNRFTQAQVRLLEDRINSRFNLARFKMFEQQVNGEVVPTCETTYNGVPYSDLNHGMKLNVGLDIINTLTEHYGLALPVWVDNAESVTRILPTEGQQIRLVVSAADKELRVELKAREGAVAHA